MYAFCEGLAVVKKSDKYGYIDKTGREVIPCQYDYAEQFYEGRAKVLVMKPFDIFYIDKTGREVAPYAYDKRSCLLKLLSLYGKETAESLERT